MMTFPDITHESLSYCPACGKSAWKSSGQVKDYSVSGEWFELKSCTVCGLKMTFPQPDEQHIGRYYASTEYVSHSDTKTGLINKLYHKARSWMLGRKLTWVQSASGLKQGSLLDVGAGTGHFAHHMQTHGWTVKALEPDDKAREVAAKKLGLAVEPLTALLTQPPGSFDVITLWHVLEHVHDLNGYLKLFGNILKEDGTLIIAVPNHQSLDAKKYGAKWAAFDVPRHLWHFSPLSMKLLFEKNGFSIANQWTMPLDAFYVSMLSEKYRANYFFGPVAATFSGARSWWKSRKHVEQGSSIIYVGKRSMEEKPASPMQGG
jgi:SAM-dependent methyltransferase